MVKTKDTRGEPPSLSFEEVERLVDSICRATITGADADADAGNFILLLYALAEETDIDARRDYVLAAQRVLIPFSHTYFTTAAALRQLGLETLRGEAGRITVELRPDLNRRGE